MSQCRDSASCVTVASVNRIRCTSWIGRLVVTANRRVVQKREDGRFEVIKPGNSRASAITETQRDGIDRARTILGNDGGGELQVRALNGSIRQQDTVHPGNDPRSSEG